MILIVEEQKDISTAVAGFLNAHKRQVMMVESGAAALALLQTRTPALIIMDFALPLLNGVSVLTVIRQNARLADVPVVMYSTCAQADLQVVAVRLGAHVYPVTRMLDYAALVRFVGTFVDLDPPAPKAA